MVEAPLPLPPATIESIQKSGLAISSAPEPEMILGNLAQTHALCLEAKRESFTPASSTSKQARGYLLATGPSFKEIVTPFQSALLCYVLPEKRRVLMEENLELLKVEMRARQLHPGETSVHGLDATADGVDYVWDSAFAAVVGTSGTRAQILKSEGPDTDPSPLLLVYSAEDYDSKKPHYAREAMLKQVWVQLLCEIHTSDPGLPLQAKTDAILTLTTDGIFNYLGRDRQRNLCRFVRERLFEPICNAWNKADSKRDDIQVSLNGNVLTILLRDEFARGVFTDWLEDPKKFNPDYSGLEPVQMNLWEPE
jgi:hypothetical protein